MQFLTSIDDDRSVNRQCSGGRGYATELRVFLFVFISSSNKSECPLSVVN